MDTSQYGLGRKVNHDPRSKGFPAPAAGTARSVRYTHYGPWLDQGHTNSCTGNALAQARNCSPSHKARQPYKTEADAMRWYSRATQIDPFPGAMPDDDGGSDGNSVCKAAKEEGEITGWQHAFGIDHMIQTLQSKENGGGGGPVIVGTNWYESSFTLTPQGFLSVDGNVVGGHEWLVFGVNVPSKFLWAGNSWGDWGPLKGKFKVAFTVMDRLLREDGDVILPVSA